MPTPIEVVRGLYAAFAAGDIPAFLAALAADVQWSEAEGFPLADRNPYVGPEAILQGVFARLGDHWRDFRVEPAEFVGSGDVVTMFGRYRATAAKSGRPLDVQVAHTFWLKDEKVVRFQQMCDTAAVAASLAVAPAPAKVPAKRPAKPKAKAKAAVKPKAKRQAAKSAKTGRKPAAKAASKAKPKPKPKRRSR